MEQIAIIQKKKDLKYKKKKYEDTCQQTPIPHVIKKGKANFIYIEYRLSHKL